MASAPAIRRERYPAQKLLDLALRAEGDHLASKSGGAASPNTVRARSAYASSNARITRVASSPSKSVASVKCFGKSSRGFLSTE
jgi:hypothetical protein